MQQHDYIQPLDIKKDMQKAIFHLGTGQKVPKDIEERLLKYKEESRGTKSYV